MLLFDDDLLDNETDVIKSDGKRSITYAKHPPRQTVSGCFSMEKHNSNE